MTRGGLPMGLQLAREVVCVMAMTKHPKLTHQVHQMRAVELKTVKTKNTTPSSREMVRARAAPAAARAVWRRRKGRRLRWGCGASGCGGSGSGGGGWAAPATVSHVSALVVNGLSALGLLCRQCRARIARRTTRGGEEKGPADPGVGR